MGSSYQTSRLVSFCKYLARCPEYVPIIGITFLSVWMTLGEQRESENVSWQKKRWPFYESALSPPSSDCSFTIRSPRRHLHRKSSALSAIPILEKMTIESTFFWRKIPSGTLLVPEAGQTVVWIDIGGKINLAILQNWSCWCSYLIVFRVRVKEAMYKFHEGKIFYVTNVPNANAFSVGTG